MQKSLAVSELTLASYSTSHLGNSHAVRALAVRVKILKAYCHVYVLTA